MENASKALFIAAGVLVGVLVLSLAIYLIASFSQLSSDIDRQNSDQKLANFNTQFTAYEGRKNLTIYDVLTIVSYAKNNNKNYTDDSGIIDSSRIIRVHLKSSKINDYVENKEQPYFDEIIKFDQAHMVDKDGQKVLPKYECSKITYNDEGRVVLVNLEAV